jgi:RimJ/RimL family protein N-acetyltransferase
MSVEELDGDFGANIWLGGCWVNRDVRGTGVMKAMVHFIDSVALDRGWQCQGLGVWHDNYPAIAAYERLGFECKGELQESTRKPGLFFQRMIRHTK